MSGVLLFVLLPLFMVMVFAPTVVLLPYGAVHAAAAAACRCSAAMVMVMPRLLHVACCCRAAPRPFVAVQVPLVRDGVRLLLYFACWFWVPFVVHEHGAVLPVLPPRRSGYGSRGAWCSFCC